MSMKLMVRVLEEADLPRPQQAVLLSMAENANDDGSRCFPSVDLIAWKAGYKPRNVVDIMRELRKAGIIEVVREATARRPTEYHIHLDKAPRKPTFEEWKQAHGRHANSVRRDAFSREVQSDEGCNLTSSGVQSHVLGVQSHVPDERENAPDPVREPANNPVREPVTHENAKKPKSAKAETPEFIAFYAAYPRKKSRADAWKAWQSIDPDDELVSKIMRAVEEQKRVTWADTPVRYIPYPASWLRGGRWEDEIEEPFNATLTRIDGGLDSDIFEPIIPGPRGYTTDQLRRKSLQERRKLELERQRATS